MKYLFWFCCLLILSCETVPKITQVETAKLQAFDLLDYRGTPSSPKDRTSLAFSDQGAWFAYGLPTSSTNFAAFSGPFLMTQENGVWSAPALSQLVLTDLQQEKILQKNDFKTQARSYHSHLHQAYENEHLKISQQVFFASAHSAIIRTNITNLSNEEINLEADWMGNTFLKNLKFQQENKIVRIHSEKSSAIGEIQSWSEEVDKLFVWDSLYIFKLNTINLKAGEEKELLISHSFYFPEDDRAQDQRNLKDLAQSFDEKLQERMKEKGRELEQLYSEMNDHWQDSIYRALIAKAVLTLQNNWRIPAGELKHQGLFPSYHYIWFHGFWAWDSWKHAVALAKYNPALAKDQIRAMFDFMDEKGFIADCVYRDTSIEAHNYRNTKPPLSAWAIWAVYEASQDLDFLKEMYPKILLQHQWWYQHRDHDKDGLCEYGSTDGTLIAAKWESGMDNAVRFDESELVKNSSTAYSLKQESVDLNAYLFAEKNFLLKIAKLLEDEVVATQMKQESETLKQQIQNQFYDSETAWFYDCSLDGKKLVKVMGCEGWIPLWAGVATQQQAEAVLKNILDTTHFNTKVPLGTLSAAHPKFKPNRGYWRGPVWLDQAYFAIKGLRRYGYDQEANLLTKKLMHNASGVLEKGISIRENYQPITGAGLESKNFSWSAAHYILLLLH